MAKGHRRPNRSRIRAARLKFQCYELYPDEQSVEKALAQHTDKYWNERVPQYHPDYGAENEVLHLATLYQQYLEMRRPQRRNSPYFNLSDKVTYLLPFLCYLWQIQNSKLVCKTLQFLYDRQKNFQTFLRQALRHPRDRYFGRATWPEARVQGVPPVSYFAHHATKAKATFGGVRFVDLRIKHFNGYKPSHLYFSCMTRNPVAVKSLLRYGACITPPPGKPQWVASLVLKLIGKAVKLGVLEDEESKARKANEVIPIKPEDTGLLELECANTLLQAMPPMRLRHIRFKPNDHWRRHFIDSADFVTTMSDRGFVPRLKYRFLEPTTLKHMCRAVVREKMQRNGELPFGIDKLEVPRELKAYLNLEGED